MLYTVPEHTPEVAAEDAICVEPHILHGVFHLILLHTLLILQAVSHNTQQHIFHYKLFQWW